MYSTHRQYCLGYSETDVKILSIACYILPIFLPEVYWTNDTKQRVTAVSFDQRCHTARIWYHQGIIYAVREVV